MVILLHKDPFYDSTGNPSFCHTATRMAVQACVLSKAAAQRNFREIALKRVAGQENSGASRHVETLNAHHSTVSIATKA